MFPSVSNTSVRVVSDVVVIGGVRFTIHDRSVGGMDDSVYESDRAVWENVPRGQSVVRIDGTPVAHIQGLRKFGYSNATYGRPDDVESIVLVDKMNGECAHIGAFEHAGIKYWIAGSKHVHILWRNGHYTEDISAYSASRYTYALKVAAVWDKMLATLLKRNEFLEFLCSTGFTACAEAILAESEHIVEYEDKDVLVFYALTDGSPSSTGLTATTPQHLVTDLYQYGLPTAPITGPFKKGSAAYTTALDAVARRNNSEGVVAYGINPSGAVCCMWKEKSYPYVMERVVREAVIHGRTRAQIMSRVAERLAEQDTSVRAYFAEWEAVRFPWLLDFADWLRVTGVLPAKKAWDVQSRWLTLQQLFRKTPEWRPAAATGSGPFVVMFVGLPGSGKSTASRCLYKMLVESGHNPCWLNQDEAASNRQRFLGAVKTAAADPTITHILLDKVNLESGNRRDYLDLGLTPSLTILFMHPDGTDAYKEVCAERFLARGNGHRCFHSAGPSAVDRDKFLRICDSMLAKAKPPTDERVLSIDVRTTLSEVVVTLAEALGIDKALCDSAIAFSAEYERALSADADVKRAKPMYGGLSVSQTSLLPSIPKEAISGGDKALRPEFHITLRYIGDIMDPVWFLKFRTLIGTSVPVKVTEIVWDDKAAVARVVLPTGVTCANAIPHITLAVAKGVQPVYSNTLLQKAEAHCVDVDFVDVDIDIVTTYIFG